MDFNEDKKLDTTLDEGEGAGKKNSEFSLNE